MHPPLAHLYFYITQGCNLKCRHCWISPRYMASGEKAPCLDFGLFQSIIEQAKPLGLQAVKLTGGEPLLHPEIERMLDHIREQSLRLTVETNGVLCTPQIAAAIARCNGRVSVSLDGAEAPTHEWVRGIPGCFEAALQGLVNLVQAGCRPQVIMSLMRHNAQEMEALVRLAEEKGAASVKFNLVQPTERGEGLHQSGETLSVAELIELGKWVETTLSATTSMRLFYDYPEAFHPLGSMFGERGNGCSRCGIMHILGVLADGSYALCGIGESVEELIFGHAARDALAVVWANSPVLQQIRNGLPARLEGVCADCLMKHLCLGTCLAQNYYAGGSFWAPFWFCQQAYDGGLFPISRLKPEVAAVR
jgi:SynChlorMet cassette radical SAM/SPASM protein ScmF